MKPIRVAAILSFAALFALAAASGVAQAVGDCAAPAASAGQAPVTPPSTAPAAGLPGGDTEAGQGSAAPAPSAGTPGPTSIPAQAGEASTGIALPLGSPQLNANQRKPEAATETTPLIGQSQPGALYRLDGRSQHMLDRLRRVLVLRQLLALGFTSADIAAALPLLRNLRDINTAPPADPDRAIEDEYRALLRANPGDPLPPNSVAKITDAAHYYRDEQAKIWNSLQRRIGARKADGLRTLLGQERVEVIENIVDPNGLSRFRDGGGSVPPGADKPQELRFAPEAPGTREGLILTQPGGLPALSGDGAQTTEPRSGAGSPDLLVQPGMQPPGASLFPDEKDGRRDLRSLPDKGMGKGNALSTPADKAAIDLRTARENQRAGKFQQSTIRISLSELIELLQEKLDAMGAPKSPRASELDTARKRVAEAEDKAARVDELVKKGFEAVSQEKAAHQELEDAKARLDALLGSVRGE
jgi:hypothetical protein